MRIGVIVNPFSGGPKAPLPPGSARIEYVRELSRGSHVTIDIAPTAGPGHADELARRFAAQGCRRVVVCGGDGTVNEAAGPLIGTDVALGIVPSGSGDGLARGLGLRKPTKAALTTAIHGPTGAVDVGFLGDRHFLNIAGVGFDAAVADVFNKRSKRGHGGYLWDSLTGVWGYRSAKYTVTTNNSQLTTDNLRFEGPRFVIAFANCREYGNGLVLVPNADPSDGLLDVVIVAGGSPIRQFWRARRLRWRRLAPAEGVHRARITTASIAGDRLECHVDGQPFETTGRLEVKIKPGAIQIAGV